MARAARVDKQASRASLAIIRNTVIAVAGLGSLIAIASLAVGWHVQRVQSQEAGGPRTGIYGPGLTMPGQYARRRVSEKQKELEQLLRDARRMTQQRKYLDAEAAYVQAQGLASEIAPSDQRLQLNIMSMRAHNFGNQGLLKRSRQILEETLQMAAASDPPDHEMIATLHIQLGLHFERRHFRDEALHQFETSLQIARDQLRDHALTGTALLSIALVQSSQSKIESAREHFDEAITAFERSGKKASVDAITECYIQSSMNMLHLRRHGEAGVHARRALSIAEQRLGPGDPLFNKSLAMHRMVRVKGILQFMTTAPPVGFQILIALVIAWQAGSRGYSPLLWVLAGLFTFPLMAVAMLGALPNFALDERRRGLQTRLDNLLEERTGTQTLASVSDWTIGDLTTDTEP